MDSGNNMKKHKKVKGHVTQCDICFEMERRGYRSEKVYWNHFFTGKLRPIKFDLYYLDKLVKYPTE